MSEPTVGDAVRAMDRKTLEKSFILLLGICEFYADPYTYFAVSLLGDPPCGDIVRDLGPTFMESRKPGRRARLVRHLVGSALGRALDSRTH